MNKTRFRFRRTVQASCLLAGLAYFPLAANAGAIFGDETQSTEALGDFTGSLLVNAGVLGDQTTTLTVTLTNTSPLANGGFLTAFVLNNPSNAITQITAFSTAFAGPGSGTSSFNLLPSAVPVNPLPSNSVSGNPFGDFDFGASSTGLDFEGGGNPSFGLDVGETGTFTFTLFGPTVESLTQASFESALSANPGGGGAQFFVARFRGFEDGGSDKVPAIPIPAAAWLLGSGLIGLLGIARRKTVAA